MSLILSFLDYCLIKRKKVFLSKNKVNFKGIKPNNLKQILCYIAIPVSVITVVLMLTLFYQSDVLFTAKRMCVFALLWPIAINDYKQYKIPNKMILIGICFRLFILILELIFSFDSILVTIVSEGIAVFAVAFMCIVCIIISRGSLGMGDLKLLMVMASFLGIEGMINSIFVSLFFSFIISVSLLFTKKKTQKDAIPFAPFILMGTFVSIILAGF